MPFHDPAHPATELALFHQPAAHAAAAPPLLFIHGAYTSAACWQPHLLPWLSNHGHDCWALSLPGHGGSPDKARLHQYSLEDYVSAVEATLPRLPAPPILIGHSLGGTVVLRLLERISVPGVVLLAPVPPQGVVPSASRLLWQRPPLLQALGHVVQGQLQAADAPQLGAALFSPRHPPPALAEMATLFQPESMRALFDLSWQGWRSTPTLPQLPALVLAAEDDALFTVEEVDACARLLHTRAHVLPGLGHAMMLDHDWLLLAQALHTWLQAHFPSTVSVR